MPASPNLIADAVVTAIQGLGLVPTAQVYKAKTPSLPPGKDVPAIVVCVGEMGAEGQTEKIDVETKLNSYPTIVTIVTAAGGKLLGDDPTLREWRIAIENELDDRCLVTFAAVPGFNKVDVTGQPPFDSAQIKNDLNFSSQTFRIEIVEARET